MLEGLQRWVPRRIVVLSLESRRGHRHDYGYDGNCPQAHQGSAAFSEKVDQGLGVVSIPGTVVASYHFGELHGSYTCKVR